MVARKVVLAVLAVALAGSLWHSARDDRRPPLEHALASVRDGPLHLRIVDAGGRTLAEATISDDGVAALAVGDLAATQDGAVLHFEIGDVPGVPRIDRAALLDEVRVAQGVTVRDARIEVPLDAGSWLLLERG